MFDKEMRSFNKDEVLDATPYVPRDRIFKFELKLISLGIVPVKPFPPAICCPQNISKY